MNAAADVQVVMVAGGKGTRLSGLVPGTAKALAPVHGRPFLSFVLQMLADQGVRRVHMCLGTYADQIMAFLETGVPDSMRVTTTVEDEPLGTGGALRLAAPALDEEFILLLGDTYTPVDLADLITRYRRDGHRAGMAVLENHGWLVPSNVRVRDGLVIAYDKSAPQGTLHHVDYGIAVLRRTELDRLPAGPADLAALFGTLIADRQLAALEVGHRFYEIGSPQGYAEFAELAARGDLPARAVRLEESAPKRAIASRTVYRSQWMAVREDIVREPDGSLAPFAVVSRPDSVVVVCELPDGRLLMTEQYRHATRRWSLEFPQGGVEPGESVTAAALRELREETGWEATDPWVLAECLHEAGDWATQRFAVVSARLVRLGPAAPEVRESGLRQRYVAPGELAGLVRAGVLSDASTLAAAALSTSALALRHDRVMQMGGSS